MEFFYFYYHFIVLGQAVAFSVPNMTWYNTIVYTHLTSSLPVRKLEHHNVNKKIRCLIILQISFFYLHNIFIMSFGSHIPPCQILHLNLLQVPELAGCWLLTFLLELPASLFLLLNEATIILPIERAMHLVYAVFVILEVIIGGIALRIMVNNQVSHI